jgi:hypothetical protein
MLGDMGSVFQDVGAEPTRAAIRHILGPRAAVWEESTALFAGVGAPVSWRYYRDGGWLAKAAAGKKTIAWLAVEEGFVRITFYFAERHRAAFRDASDLGPEVRERIEATPLSGKLLPVTFEVRDSADVALVGAVLAIKLAVK